MPSWMALSFQDRTSPNIEQLLFFHDHSIIILILITILTLNLIISIVIRKRYHKFLIEGQEIETIWTILPAVILLFIALPSIKILYLIEDTSNPRITIKVNGHQWYWSHEYSITKNEEFDTFIETSKMYRLIKTRDIIFIPVKTSIRILISSTDVIHAWAIPSIGVKVDALPGRINQTFLTAKRLGLYSGQCSEICGTNHSFIPIIVNAVSTKRFIRKMKSI